ncbi:molybdenum cofactor biosynthesis protein MoaE [Sphingomonas swuensis]
MVEVADAPLVPAERLARFEAALGGRAGAMVTFTGLTRREASDGSAVSALFLDHHPVLTLRSLEDIAAAGAERFDLVALEVAHRRGQVAAGEAIVWVAAAAPHRRAAFEAVDLIMDRLKTEAVFWKREDGPEGSRWIEPTALDRESRSRWG